MVFFLEYSFQVKESFNNHVDIISRFFDHPPTSVDIFYVLNVDKFGKILTTYLTPIVHMVIEWPLSEFEQIWNGFEYPGKTIFVIVC